MRPNESAAFAFRAAPRRGIHCPPRRCGPGRAARPQWCRGARPPAGTPRPGRGRTAGDPDPIYRPVRPSGRVQQLTSAGRDQVPGQLGHRQAQPHLRQSRPVTGAKRSHFPRIPGARERVHAGQPLPIHFLGREPTLRRCGAHLWTDQLGQVAGQPVQCVSLGTNPTAHTILTEWPLCAHRKSGTCGSAAKPKTVQGSCL